MSTLWDKTLPFLKAQNADIMVLQEVMHQEGSNLPQMHRTKQYLQENLGYKYSAYIPLCLDMRHKPPALFGNMTLSKFPILESKEIFFDRPFGNWDESVGNLLVPGQLRGLQRGFFSISHCPLFGGYVLQEAPLVGRSIGFDLEQASRVSPEIVNRISTPSEMTDSPDPASLWTAKESLYKSLPDGIQPAAISGVRVSDWSVLSDNLYSFSGLISSPQHFHNSHGLLWTFNDLKMGLCLSWI
jgi:hypothetical protein